MSDYKKTALVLGAGGFIGSHMVKRLRSEGYWVRGVDLKYPEYGDTEVNEFIIGDLRSPGFVNSILEFKGIKETTIALFLISIFFPLMRSISLLLIWVGRICFHWRERCRDYA